MTKNAVITGATKGIGYAILSSLAKDGYSIGFCSRSKKDVDHLAQQLSKDYPNQKFVGLPCDISIKEKVEKFASKMLADMGNVDVLINNGGVFLPGEISNEEVGNLEMMINTNLYSAYYLTRALLPSMKTNHKGHVINMCSVASQIAYPNGGSYSISKFALLGFSKVLREEMKPHNIKVTSILPGATWSDSWKGVDLPESRLMQADDIAKLVMCALSMSDSATIEDIVIRPQLGDL
jgi:short-subunit dehydrogenase